MLDDVQVLTGYRMGIFPMALDATGRIGWFSPDPRGVIPLDDRFRVPRGLRRTLRTGRFEVTADRAFDQVIQACATSHGETWISQEIIGAYTAVHRRGCAHSIEVWLDGELAGGLYGVHLGGAFFGESMFHRVTDASKVALVSLVERLRQGGSILLDTQWVTPHLRQFGAFVVPRQRYLRWLHKALTVNCRF